MDVCPPGSQQLNNVRNSSFMKLFRLLFAKQGKAYNNNMMEMQDLVESIKKARSEWVVANMNFELAEAPEMVDYYIYSIKACEVKYEYLLKKAKDIGIRVDGIDAGNSYSISEAKIYGEP